MSIITEMNEAEVQNAAGIAASEIVIMTAKNVLKTIYPIGSVYMSFTNADPYETLGFGGWEQISGRFLIGADDDEYPVDENGGSDSVTLSVGNMPSHSHTFYASDGATADSSTYPVDSEKVVQGSGVNATTRTQLMGVIGDEGQGTPFKIIPPYIAVYMWKRLS